MVELEEIESPPREPPPQRVEAKEPRSAATESAAGLPSFAAPGAAGRGDEASSASSAVDSGGQAEPSVRSQGSAGPIPGEGLASDWKRGSASTPSGSTAEPQGSQEGTQAAEQDRQAAEEGRGDEEEGEEAFKDAVEGGAAPATVEGALEADGAGDEEAAFTDALTEEELRKVGQGMPCQLQKCCHGWFSLGAGPHAVPIILRMPPRKAVDASGHPLLWRCCNRSQVVRK